MLFKLSVASLLIVSLVGCGKGDSGIHNPVQTPASPDAPNEQNKFTEDQPPTPATPVVRKKMKVSEADTDDQDQDKDEAETPVVVVPAKAAPVDLKPIPQGSKAVVQTSSRVVVGFGTTSQKSENMLDRGYGFAVADAQFCAVSGKSTNGSPCFVVYNDGKTEWVNALNRQDFQIFILDLKKKNDEQKNSKKTKKTKKQKPN